MTKTETKQFIEKLHSIAMMYRADMNDDIAMIWVDLLSPWSYRDIMKALHNHILFKKTMPMPSDIFDLLSGSLETMAQEALAFLLEAMDRIGPYETVVFDNPVIHATVRSLGGWTRLFSIEERDFPFWKKNFLLIYVGYAKKELQGILDYPAKLFGLKDIANAQFNITSTPVYLGDAVKARSIEQRGEAMHALVKKELEALVAPSGILSSIDINRMV